MIRKYEKFLRYCVVGGIGTGVDVGVLYFFHGVLSLPLLISTTLAFLAAVMSNFLGNKFWAFKDTSRKHHEQFLKFFLVSCFGLVLTLGLMQVFTIWLGIFYIVSKLLTSGIVLTWNFAANSLWTFKKERIGFLWDGHSPLSLSIIVPAYNEEKRLSKTLEEIVNYFQKRELSFEVLVVDDGSSDNTFSLAKAFFQKHKNGKALSYGKNQGKGYAVRFGVEAARGKYILFTDADGSTPIAEFETLFSHIQKADIAIGSRYLQKEKVKKSQPKYRVAMGRFANRMIQKLFLDGIRDTQCGFKLFRDSVAKDIFSHQKIDRFGFDIEILSIAKLRGYTISEVPVSWYNDEGSRFRPIRDALITLRDVFRIKWNLLWGKYD